MPTQQLVVPQTRQQVSDQLWKKAYDALEEDDRAVLETQGSPFSLKNAIFIQQISSDKQKSQWTITMRKKKRKVRDIGLKLVAFIDGMKDMISPLADLEPHASLAWSGVSILLQYIINIGEQEETMLSGLERVAYLLGYYKTWERMYLDNMDESSSSCIVKLYSSILSYQARTLAYLTKPDWLGALRNSFGVDKWSEAKQKIEDGHDDCQKFGAVVNEQRVQDMWVKQTTLSTGMLLAIQQLLNDARLEAANRLSQEQRKQYSKLVQSLRTDFMGQKELVPTRTPGTFEWLIDDPVFRAWQSSVEPAFLYICAGPGCGKSVLTRFLIDEGYCASSPSVPVLHFFFKDGNEDQMTSHAAFASVLFQLITKDGYEAVSPYALPRFKDYGDMYRQSFVQLRDTLDSVIKDESTGEIVIVCDALDECPIEDRRALLKALAGLYQMSRTNGYGVLKVIVTSRPDAAIEYSLAPIVDTMLSINMDEGQLLEKIQADIDIVLRTRVHQMTGVRQEIQSTIINELCRYTNSTYLWVHLTLDYIEKNLAGHGTHKKVQRLLRTLPPDLHSAYKAILSTSTDFQSARRILQIVVAAKRPLSVTELNIAQEIATNADDITSIEDLDLEPYLVFEKSLRSLCGLMLRVKNFRVELIHQTARVFLTERIFHLQHGEDDFVGPLSPISADLTLTQICWRYLRFPEVEQKRFFNLFVDIDSAYKTPCALVNFGSYAKLYLGDHIRDCESRLSSVEHEDLKDLIRVHAAAAPLCPKVGSVLHEQGSDIEFWSEAVAGDFHFECGLLDPVYKSQSDNRDSEGGLSDLVSLGFDLCNTTADQLVLQFAVQKGLLRLATDALKCNAHFPNHAMVTNLLLDATRHDGGQILQLLLKQPTIQLEKIDYQLVTCALAEKLDPNMMQALFDTASIAVPKMIGEIFAAAVAQKCSKVICVIHDRTPDRNVLISTYHSGLCKAASDGDRQTVQTILVMGQERNIFMAMVHPVSPSMSDPMRIAMREGHAAIVELLIDYGVKASRYPLGKDTALDIACKHTMEEVAERLFDLSQGTSELGDLAARALHYALSSRLLSLAREMIKVADFTECKEACAKALRAAATVGELDMVISLLDAGAEIETNEFNELPALAAAALEGHHEIAEVLIDHRANINAPAGRFGNALSAASWAGHPEMVRLLLDKKLDLHPNRMSAYAWTYRSRAVGQAYLVHPLEAAACAGHADIARLLLEHGADVNAKSSKGTCSPLIWACRNGYLDVMQVLIDWKADINVQWRCGARNISPLEEAEKKGQDGAVKLLLDDGAKRRAAS